MMRGEIWSMIYSVFLEQCLNTEGAKKYSMKEGRNHRHNREEDTLKTKWEANP